MIKIHRLANIMSFFLNSFKKRFSYNVCTGTTAGGTELTGGRTAAATTGGAANDAARRRTAATTAQAAERGPGAGPDAKSDAAGPARTGPAGSTAQSRTATATTGGTSARRPGGLGRKGGRPEGISGISKISTKCGTSTSGLLSCRLHHRSRHGLQGPV